MTASKESASYESTNEATPPSATVAVGAGTGCCWRRPAPGRRTRAKTPATEPKPSHRRSTASRCSTSATTSSRFTPTGTTRCASRSCRRPQDQFGKDGSTFAGVRQSRLGVKTVTPTALRRAEDAVRVRTVRHRRRRGPDDVPAAPRLRRARHVRRGPDWSPFMDPDVFPNSLEYRGPTGMVFFRNVQVRWMPIKGDTNLTLALERPGASGDAGVLRRPHRAAERQGPLPDARLHRRVPLRREVGLRPRRPACSARSSGTTCSTTSTT